MIRLWIELMRPDAFGRGDAVVVDVEFTDIRAARDAITQGGGVWDGDRWIFTHAMVGFEPYTGQDMEGDPSAGHEQAEGLTIPSAADVVAQFDKVHEGLEEDEL